MTDWFDGPPVPDPGGKTPQFPDPSDTRALYGEGLALDVPSEWPGAAEMEYDDLGSDKQYDPSEDVPSQVDDIESGMASEDALTEALEDLPKGEALDLDEGITVARTTGDAGRFKLRAPGQRVRTITGARQAARALVQLPVGPGSSEEGSDGGTNNHD